MATLSLLWERVNDFVALQGSSGATLSNIFESLQIAKKLQIPVVSKLFKAGLCQFYLAKEASSSNVPSKSLMSFEDFQRDMFVSFDDIYCVADITMSWKAYGFESYHDIPDSQTPLLLAFLEILGMAREKGCSNTEASLLLGIPKLHTVVERLVSLGYVVKRMVLPIYGKLATCRVKSRTALLHLKRFAAQYDPTPDDIEIEADDSMRGDINTYFTKLMDFHGVQYIAVTDAAHAIGIGSKRLIKLKDSFANYAKSGLPGVSFMDKDVPLIYPGRQPLTRVRSCLGFVNIKAVKAESEHEVAMNAPLYEQCVARLRWSNGEGMSSTTLRAKLCLYNKRAQRVAIELNTVHGYPMKKQQVGKTQTNQLYDKIAKEAKRPKATTRRIPAAARKDRDDIEKDTSGKGGITDRALDTVPDSIPDQTATSSNQIATAGIVNHSPGIESSSSTLLPTDLRTSRIKVIMDTLTLGGGVSSVQEITHRIRHTDYSAGLTIKADSKTVARLLDHLQSANKIILLTAILPKGISLVINKEGVTSTTNSSAVSDSNEAKLVVLLGEGDPQQLLAMFMDCLMRELEARNASAPKPFDRCKRVGATLFSGNMRNTRRRKKKIDSDSEDGSDGSDYYSGGNDDRYDDDGGHRVGVEERPTRSSKRGSNTDRNTSNTNEDNGDFEDRRPDTLPATVYTKVDPRVGFPRGGRIRRKRGKGLIERALVCSNSATQGKWRISLLSTLMNLRAPGLFAVASHIHFEICLHFFEQRAGAFSKMGPGPKKDDLRVFRPSDLLGNFSVLKAISNFECSEELREQFLSEHESVMEGRAMKSEMEELFSVLVDAVSVTEYSSEQFGLDIFSNILLNSLGGVLAALVSLGVLVPSNYVLNIARDILKTEEAERVEKGEGGGRGSGVSDRPVGGAGSNKDKSSNDDGVSLNVEGARNAGSDEGFIDTATPIDEEVLSLFARAASTSLFQYKTKRANNDSTNSNYNSCDPDTQNPSDEDKNENEYTRLLQALPVSELHLSLTPIGCQGYLWSDGDVSHYWKYTVYPSLRNTEIVNVGSDKFYNSANNMDNNNEEMEGNEDYLNKFFTPIESPLISARWSKPVCCISEDDFDELKVVRQRRSLEREREREERDVREEREDESSSEMDIEHIASYSDLSTVEQTTTSTTPSAASAASIPSDDRRRKKIPTDRRVFTGVGFTPLGIAGCVSAPEMDPTVRPRARVRKREREREERGGRGDRGGDRGGGEEEREEEDDDASDPLRESVELRDDWILVPGSSHHTYRGDVFESLQQEDWSNYQNCCVLEVCLREYFLKKKTLPPPLARYFELQRSMKEKSSENDMTYKEKEERDKQRKDSEVSGYVRIPPSRFLSDPALALIDRDFCASHLISVVRRIRTPGALNEVPGKSPQLVSRRIIALLKSGNKNFSEFLTVRQTLLLILAHKSGGSPSTRTGALNDNLIEMLNGVLDPEVFATKKQLLRESDTEQQVAASKGVGGDTGVHLRRATINRAMQVYCDSNKVSRKRGLQSMMSYPVDAVAAAQREMCWNDWIYYPSSKNRRLGPREGFVITAGFYGNLISPLCTAFGLLVKPIAINNHISSSTNNKERSVVSTVRASDDSEEVPVGQKMNAAALDLDGGNSTEEGGDADRSLENPWLLRSLMLAESTDDSKEDAVSVNEAVLFSHAFGLQSSFDSGEISVSISDYSKTEDEGEVGGEVDPQDPEEKDPDDEDRDPANEDSNRQQAKLQFTAPISFYEPFFDKKSMQAVESSSSLQKSLCKVHQGRYCNNLNRLQFEFKFVPTVMTGRGILEGVDSDIPLTGTATSNTTSNTSWGGVCSNSSGSGTTVDVDASSEVEKWLHHTITAVGANGISLQALQLSYEAQYTRDSFPPVVDLMATAEALKNRGAIIIDYGQGFCTGGLRCIEPLEDRPVYFVDSSFSSLYMIDTSSSPSSSVYPEEYSCPWVTVGGRRNELFYRMLRSKVASILSERPGSSLKAIHAGFPQLTFDQVNLLVCSMAREKVVFSRVPSSSVLLANPFKKRSTQKPCTGYYLRL